MNDSYRKYLRQRTYGHGCTGTFILLKKREENLVNKIKENRTAERCRDKMPKREKET